MRSLLIIGLVVTTIAGASCSSAADEPRDSLVDDSHHAALQADAPNEGTGPALVMIPGTATAGSAPVGQAPGGGPLVVRDLSGEGTDVPIQITVDGPFEVDGRISALDPWEQRELSVRYVGAIDHAVFARGVATIHVGSTTRRVLLSAAIVEREIPAIAWEPGAIGVTGVAALASAPFPFKARPYEDRAVLLFVPAGFDGRGPTDFIVHLHGYGTTAREETVQHRLREQLAASARLAVLVVPQGPVEARDSDFGRLMVAGGLRRLLEDVTTVLHRDGLVREARIGRVVLSAHSGGYHAAAMLLERGGVEVTEVHLHDAFYGFEPTFLAFIEAGGRFRSSWTGGTTERYNRKLSERLHERGIAFSTDGGPEGLVRSDVTVWRTPWRHAECVGKGDTWRLWLESSGLDGRELE